MPRKTQCWFRGGTVLRVLAFLLPVSLFAVIGFSPVRGQNVPGLEQLMQQQMNRQPAVSPDVGQPQSAVMQPETQERAPQPPSRLEQIMSNRANATLRQFGYDQIGNGRAVAVPQTGAVQDDYILGAGDEIVVSLRGQEDREIRNVVDRNGQVTLPRLSPVPAAGRSLGSFRRDVEAAVSRAYVATNVFVSVSRVRLISVLVSGEVNNPGLRLVSGLASVVDALLLSGGIRKTGSLRNIRVERGSRIFNIDLYSVLTAGGSNSVMRLADGDRILVPLLGRTVAVSGLVRQPGIFEMPPRAATISVSALLALAGGEEVRGLYRLSALRIEADGRSNLVAVREQEVIRDSEILFVQLGANQVVNQATLSGGSGLAGNYAIASGMRLSQLLRQPGALGDTPYTLFGLIVRRDPLSLVRTLVPFTPVAVLAGREDIALQGDDTVRVFSAIEVRMLDYVIRTYLQRLAQADAALRNPLQAPSEASAGSQAFAVVQRQQEQDQQLAAVQSYIFNVPSEIQRNAIVSLLENAAPGSPLAVARAEERQARQDAMDRQDALAARPRTQQEQPNMVAVVPSRTFSSSSLAQNFQEIQVNSDRFARNREAQTFGDLARQLEMDPLVLVNFLVEHRARLDGAVRGPGDYLIGLSATLSDLVTAAGGAVSWADQKGIELITSTLDRENGRGTTQLRTLPLNSTNLASYIVRPSDQLRFTQISVGSIGSVTVQGEVHNPGAFALLRGDRLSDVLARAGGLTEVAYPAGTVFLRQSVAQKERESFQRAAREVQEQLMVGMTRVGNTRIEPTTFASLQAFVTELREQRPMGRVSIVADPSVLASRPELDPLLEPGDVIYLPQRPSTISVLGQVLQPGSYPYRAGESIADYIARAGGFARTADESQAYLVLPDGSARRWERSWFHFDATSLAPGSAIVVPRDVTPLDLRQTLIDVTQILSQLVVSIASVAVISKQ